MQQHRTVQVKWDFVGGQIKVSREMKFVETVCPVLRGKTSLLCFKCNSHSKVNNSDFFHMGKVYKVFIPPHPGLTPGLSSPILDQHRQL